MVKINLKHSLSAKKDSDDKKGPNDTPSKKTEEDTPIKISIDSSSKQDGQVGHLNQEIKELESSVRQMRQTLEDSYRKQRDLANERSKLKQRI